MKIFLVLVLAVLGMAKEEEIQVVDNGVSDFIASAISHPCQENGVVASWCDVTVNPGLECTIHPTLNVYTCKCSEVSQCPSECVEGDSAASELVKKTTYSIQCRGIPEDEPNYILRNRGSILPLHHCENNAIVANWCNEATVPEVSCLLLPSLDEYVCTCHDKVSACPTDCVNGEIPDKKSKHGIRCKGIPQDSPNYVLKQTRK